MQLIVLLLTIVYAHELYFIPEESTTCQMIRNDPTNPNYMTLGMFVMYPLCYSKIEKNTMIVNETWINSLDEEWIVILVGIRNNDQSYAVTCPMPKQSKNTIKKDLFSKHPLSSNAQYEKSFKIIGVIIIGFALGMLHARYDYAQVHKGG